ncbi:Tudor domain, partial [Trinorchestia longiramus]
AIFLRLAFHTPHFNLLQNELDAAVESNCEACDVSVSIGKMYVAASERPPYLARVKILVTEPEDRVKVLLVDCGGTLSLPVFSLRPLPSHLASIKPMAFLASLHDILPPGGQKKWPCTTVDALKDILSSVSSLYVLKQ